MDEQMLNRNLLPPDGFREAKRKPRKCRRCGSSKIASILYGLPAWDEEMQKEIDEGKLVLGGCCVRNDDPKWQCVDCQMFIFKDKG